jgi:ABC-type phosphate/phosphonate transport system substrate-binding protein
MNRRIALVVAGCALFLAAVQARAAGQGTKTIALGFVSEKPPAEVEAHLKDFTAYVAQKLNVEGKVVTAKTPSQLANAIETKKVLPGQPQRRVGAFAPPLEERPGRIPQHRIR